MLFQRLLKRRNPPPAANASPQGAANPQVKPNPLQGQLIEQALRAGDLERRLEAVRQLTDLETLILLLGEDNEPAVRTAALERLILCLCQPHGPLPETWSTAIAQIQGPAQFAQLARFAHDPEVRRAAIERLSDPEVLIACAIQDPSPSNRMLALERIEDRAALESVVRGIGKKDKRIYRRARERLRLLAEQAERPRIVRERCAEICAQVERLGRLGQWNQDRALLDYLERQWAAIQDEAEPEWREHFERERNRFLSDYAAYLAAQARAQSGASALTPEGTSAGSQEAQPVEDGPKTTAGAPDPSQGPAAPWVEVAEQTPVEQGQPRPPLESLVKINARIEQLLQASRPLDHKQAQRLLERGRARAAHWPQSEAAQLFQAYAERLETRLRNQRRHAEQRLRQFPERLADLEEHLEEGELKKADPLYQSLSAALELIQASGIESESVAEFERRLRLLAPRLRELQNWRRWGADQHREALCAEMESLLAQEIPLEALAERLHTLQMDWKRIDRTGAPVNQALWERFHTASEQVYARCRPFIEAQAAEREVNRLAREQICTQLEDFLAKVDWERVDWKKALKAERELRQAWTALGPTEGRVRKALERRFYRSLRVLEQHLEAERERNQALKRDLVARAQALVEHPDLNEAIAQAKALQQQWHTTVPGRQRDENRLWKAFRAACDAVFARRAARQQAQSEEQAKNLALLEAICTEAEQLAASEQDPKRLTAALRDLSARWREAESVPLPRQTAAAIHRRWQSCRQALEHRRQALERRQRQAELEQLASQAAFCVRIEQALLEGQETELKADEVRQEWAALPALKDPRWRQALTARLERALAALADESARFELHQAATANVPRRAELCLRLEIAAGVETPAEFAEQRLKLQVARLAERLAEREGGSKPQGLDLLIDWYLLGPAPRDEALERRFERARAALLAELS